MATMTVPKSVCVRVKRAMSINDPRDDKSFIATTVVARGETAMVTVAQAESLVADGFAEIVEVQDEEIRSARRGRPRADASESSE